MEKTNCHHSKQRTDYLVSAISGVIPSWYTRPRVQAQTHLAFWRPRETRTQTLILFFAGNAGPTLLFTSVSASCCFWITKRRENKRDRSCLWRPFRRRLRVGLPLCGWNSGADAFPFFFWKNGIIFLPLWIVWLKLNANIYTRPSVHHHCLKHARLCVYSAPAHLALQMQFAQLWCARSVRGAGWVHSPSPFSHACTRLQSIKHI